MEIGVLPVLRPSTVICGSYGKQKTPHWYDLYFHYRYTNNSKFISWGALQFCFSVDFLIGRVQKGPKYPHRLHIFR
ncbi:unnamed protein product [Acanthoscelides obtectus]|uniref:Uncharacterized protein n=1 Tax=Acanthoscelides obtectus TaxID=200917 RepID=A0A9P0JY68_ACAOB|nr:unnamed protein product [Acanthoscelides obtectus]CAK1632025.1 hypothetical protein AOBTE_LOCUS7314 [Acanthoscelides obtectus]